MSRLIVTASASSPPGGGFHMLVSVSAESDGKPIKALKPNNFKIYSLGSEAFAKLVDRNVTRVDEGPSGFYNLVLEQREDLPPFLSGHYVFGVAVETSLEMRVGKLGSGVSPLPKDHGQTIAVGDYPSFG